ncbi:FMRFamide receptor-like [Plakobranchus ocellatus]|uniref:FMRFamide receptor-like n=1 Tax=Plakobranchus ocellatus TaxID=259542 RepID=A0AAV4CPV9_9GAST|nr:FMRFamide receptor-like [Plakobranchus ocellatus]
MACAHSTENQSCVTQTSSASSGNLLQFLNADGASEELKFVWIATRLVINPVVLVWGILASIVNIIVFCKLGLGEGVTQNFLILSVADGLLCLISSVSTFHYIVYWLGLDNGILAIHHMESLALFVFNYPLSLSLITTAVIAVVRCCCVNMPFKVRKLLTARRQLLAILLLGLLDMSVMAYTNSCMRVLWHVQLPANLTYLFPVAFVESRCGENPLALYDLRRSIVFGLCFATALVSMIVLFIALRKSSRFRRLATNTSRSIEIPEATTKEVRVVKSALLVLAVFTVCNFPLVLLSLIRQTRPEFGSDQETYFTFMWFISQGLHFNAAFNIFIYYFSNSRYRKILKAVFQRRRTYAEGSQ